MMTIYSIIVGLAVSIIVEKVKHSSEVTQKKYNLYKLSMQREQINTQFNSSNNKIVTEKKTHHSSKIHNLIILIDTSIRPILAYSFFLLYAFSKYAIYKFCLHNLHDQNFNFSMIWSDSDHVLFSGIISFYYGQKSFRKKFNKKYE